MLITAIRVFLALIFFTAGMAKLTHGDFVGLIGPAWLIDRLAPYGLGLWATFVAWSQVAVGLLLMSRRTALIGAIMLVPLLANILVVTISLGWRGTPYINAVLLALNLALLTADRHRLWALVPDPEWAAPAPAVRPNAGDAVWTAAVVFCVLAVLLHPVSRWLTFGLSAAAMMMLLVNGWRGARRRAAGSSAI